MNIEDTFDVFQVMAERRMEVIELMQVKTMEWIREMVGVWLDRERVSRVWG